MVGRLTSVAPGVNEHGVPYRELLERVKANNKRLIHKLTVALERFKRLEEARANKAPNRTVNILRQLALEDAEKALG